MKPATLRGGTLFQFPPIGRVITVVCTCLWGTFYGAALPAQEADNAADGMVATSEGVVAEEATEATEPTMLSDDALSSTSAAAHNAWMLISCALVLFMTAPGLAMFYGGLVRKKNVLSVMMQCIFLMAMMTCLWAIYGYSLAFGGSNPFIGNLDYLFMNGVARVWDEGAQQPLTPMAGAIPRLTHMLFQGMFFIITPALICGAFAERMKFGAMVLFSLLWGTFIYCPLAHWVWGGGILAYGEPGSWMGGALDFAGGTVVHISSGVTALVAALMIGPRVGYRQEPMPPHNLTYTAMGAAMLWFGWFGFNAGSELMVDGITASAFAVTHFAAAAGALTWPIIEWMHRGRPTVLGASSGAVAGLVCITPAAGFVGPMAAIVMGVLAGAFCYIGCSGIKGAFGYDDALDAFGIHGLGGLLGAVLTGVFATRAIWDIADGNPLGLIEGNTSTIVGQVVGALVTCAFAAIGAAVLLKIVDALVGLRVAPAAERQGLDVTEHGEEGYIFL
ncbi:MAG: ammonium transporter [Pirellulaceae bacterium]|nr:MAG: ammonium transporter [Pirellulaceae bacterium]